MITNFYIFYFIIKLFIYFVGIKGKSVFFELLSFNFPRSFPIDIMHLFLKMLCHICLNYGQVDFLKMIKVFLYLSSYQNLHRKKLA